ncbi:hypothetical protein V6N13_047275 [Hibiscus sabdariffa]|uniref:DUF4283 domain-containing protein n=1 Tax=Hibiscus sabdariffa TaxID=183260 RepID=A0ABR2F3L3_9ROSI
MRIWSRLCDRLISRFSNDVDSCDKVLLIFDDVGERTRMLASDSMSKWFGRVVEWNEEDCAMGCRKVWISIFGVSIHAWSRETFERVMSHWGNVILVSEETLEPSSFERGRVLIETGVLDQIEERLELVVEGHKFPIRLSEANTFLRGPRCSCSRDAQDSSTDSEWMENHSQDAPAEQEDRVDAVRQFDKDNEVVEVGGADSKSEDEVAVEGIGTMVTWRENELWEDPKGASSSSVSGHAGATIEPTPVLLNMESTANWVSVPIADGVELQIGPDAEGSNTEILFRHGSKKKVRLLTDVIRSTLSPQEKLHADKQLRKRKG